MQKFPSILGKKSRDTPSPNNKEFRAVTQTTFLSLGIVVWNTGQQANQFALINLLFAYFKQPKQIFWLKMEPSLDSFFAFFKQFNFYEE